MVLFLFHFEYHYNDVNYDYEWMGEHCHRIRSDSRVHDGRNVQVKVPDKSIFISHFIGK